MQIDRVAALTFAIGLLSVLLVIVFVLIRNINTVAVTDFDSCVIDGGAVEEVFPRRCTTDGKVFVETIDNPIQYEDNRFDVDSGESTREIWVVGERMVDCESIKRQRCLLVDGEPFDDVVVGFDYQEGNIYKIIVSKTPNPLLNNENRPAENVGLYIYELEQVVSLTYIFTPEPVVQEPEPIVEKPFVPTVEDLRVTIGPFKVDCGRFDLQPCLVVDEEPVGYDIDGFRHETGYNYVLEVTKTQLYPKDRQPLGAPLYGYVLKREVSRTALPGINQESSTSTATTVEETN